MNNYSKIKELISGMKTKDRIFHSGEVLEVGTDRCSVKIGSLVLIDVRLRSVLNGNQDYMIIKPQVGSMVTVADTSGGDLRTTEVVQYSEVASVEISIGGKTVSMDKTGVFFNGGHNGGLVNISALTQRLNNIERDINMLKTVFSTWVVVPQDGGAALKAAATVWASSRLTETTNSNYEDTTIKH